MMEKLLELAITTKASRHEMGRLFSAKRRERNWWSLVTCQWLPSQKMKFTCLTFPMHPSLIISEPHKLKNKQGTQAGPMQFPILCLSASATKPTRAKYGGLLTCSPWSVTCLDGVTSWLNLNLRRHFLWPKLDEVYLQTCFFSVVLLFFLKIFIPMFESFSGN